MWLTIDRLEIVLDGLSLVLIVKLSLNSDRFVMSFTTYSSAQQNTNNLVLF